MARLYRFTDFVAGLVRTGKKTRKLHRDPNRSALMVERLEGRVLLAAHPHDHVAHPDDPVRQEEHAALLALVPHDAVTHEAVVDGGDWSDPATWDQNEVPPADANVLIPHDFEVTVDAVFAQEVGTIRVDGTLEFETDVNTGLAVETLVVSPTGTFIMGTEDDPIDDDVMAKIIIADRGPVDREYDPHFLSRGFLSHGSVVIHGAETTSFVPLAEDASRRDTELVFADVPDDWDVGDRLIVTGTSYNREDEVEILGVTDTTVTVDRLRHHHRTPADDLEIFVANVSRNAVIESEEPGIVSRRGHAMFMHSSNVDVAFAGFYGLGRTDKRTPVEDPEFDNDGNLVPDTGLNPRGRYAAHFHRTGAANDPANVTGIAVVDSPGWGVVNHSSNVIVEDSVVFNVEGAAFVTEAGDETGAFRGNIAIRSHGSRQKLKAREDVQDFGHQGDGFWFQGAGVEATDNVATGHRNAGFIFFTKGLVQDGLGRTQFLAANLSDPSIAGEHESISVGSVPITNFTGNTAYAVGAGLETWFHQLHSRHDARSHIKDFTAWNTRGRGIRIPYTNQTTLENVRLLGRMDRPRSVGIDRNDVTRNIEYLNPRVEGFKTGIRVPVRGTNVIEDGQFNNVVSIEITTARDTQRVIDINGDPQFGELSARALRGKTQFDIYLRAKLNVKDRDITRLFARDIIRLGTVRYNGKQLYFFEQAAGFVPFKSGEAADYVPAEFLDKTNQELWDEFGLAIGGAVAPVEVIRDSRINALIGDPAEYLPDLKMLSRKYTSRVDGYRLVYRNADGERVRESQRLQLREGWNVITREIDGHTRTFLVFGDTTPPEFVLSDSIELRINPADLRKGIRIQGKLLDDSLGEKKFKRRFRNLDRLELQTDDQGNDFVMLEFTVRDRAGNRMTVELKIVVDADYPREHVRNRRNVARRNLPPTLLALLGF